VQKKEAQTLSQDILRAYVELARQDREKHVWIEVLACRDQLVKYGLTNWIFDQKVKAPFSIKGHLGSGGYSVVNEVSWKPMTHKRLLRKYIASRPEAQTELSIWRVSITRLKRSGLSNRIDT
jgi:hypothetical protein